MMPSSDAVIGTGSATNLTVSPSPIALTESEGRIGPTIPSNQPCWVGSLGRPALGISRSPDRRGPAGCGQLGRPPEVPTRS